MDELSLHELNQLGQTGIQLVYRQRHQARFIGLIKVYLLYRRLMSLLSVKETKLRKVDLNQFSSMLTNKHAKTCLMIT